jgi:hypothetical protein
MTDSIPSTHRRTNRRSARRRQALAATAAIVALGLGACSASGGAATAEPAPTTAPTNAPTGTDTPQQPVDPQPDPEPEPTPDPTTPPTTDVPSPDGGDVAEIEARLAAINLTLDDLPEGWTSEPAIEKTTTVVDDCTTLGGPENILARSSSDRLSLVVEGGGLGLDTSSGYAIDTDTAAALLSELGSSDFATCATEQLLSGGEDVTVEGAFQPIDGGLDLGDGASALQGDFQLSDATGQSAQMSVIIVTIRTGQILTTVSAISYDVAGDEQLLYQVLDTVAARQAAV